MHQYQNENKDTENISFFPNRFKSREILEQRLPFNYSLTNALNEIEVNMWNVTLLHKNTDYNLDSTQEYIEILVHILVRS